MIYFQSNVGVDNYAVGVPSFRVPVSTPYAFLLFSSLSNELVLVLLDYWLFFMLMSSPLGFRQRAVGLVVTFGVLEMQNSTMDAAMPAPSFLVSISFSDYVISCFFLSFLVAQLIRASLDSCLGQSRSISYIQIFPRGWIIFCFQYRKVYTLMHGS